VARPPAPHQHAAAAYVDRWPDHPPDYFVDTSRKRRELTHRAFDHGTGWAARLVSSLETPAHFTLHTEHLDLSREAAAPALLFDRANVDRWKRAIRDHFTGPCRWKLELGRCGRVHAHILADLDDGPAELPRGGQVVKPCLHYLDAVVGYVSKPPLEYCAEHLALWSEAKRRGRLPRLSGTMNLPNKTTWNNPSYLRVYSSKQPVFTPKTENTESQTTRPPRRPAPVLRQPRVTWSRRPLVKSTPTTGPPGASIRRPTNPQHFDQIRSNP
jgi:hypothetical protein